MNCNSATVITQVLMPTKAIGNLAKILGIPDDTWAVHKDQKLTKQNLVAKWNPTDPNSTAFGIQQNDPTGPGSFQPTAKSGAQVKIAGDDVLSAYDADQVLHYFRILTLQYKDLKGRARTTYIGQEVDWDPSSTLPSNSLRLKGTFVGDDVDKFFHQVRDNTDKTIFYYVTSSTAFAGAP
jgi:hypothetical protein